MFSSRSHQVDEKELEDKASKEKGNDVGISGDGRSKRIINPLDREK